MKNCFTAIETISVQTQSYQLSLFPPSLPSTIRRSSIFNQSSIKRSRSTQACLGMYLWVSFFFFFFPILQCYSLSLICEKTLLLYLSTHFTSPYDSFFMRGNCFCPNMLVRERLQIICSFLQTLPCILP